ncbi:signal peptidase II [Prevotella aff. ruminicola Tc2-24]|jgi:signal peptidase II|uniref:Lipoprotein signal peptidase n=1 Tax=Prevotella aff. ruminicola Tc2-24 TaxID=81582 RepID=A0A1I0M6N1_9BACT|nr:MULTISPECIES: lipoprotein signal peptidase [Prevotella]MBR5988648.1 lipoprotein signal peptidase [Prevotella sp.]SEE04658.1 signal peptidase II [Prevotella sp. lc2012]SEV83386.1 signal peptidase II [Prevotella aff. ruminicola Tc2-24]
MTKGRVAALVVVAILLIDQAIKIWVKTSMTLHESIHVFDWFYITFIENMGMAFGMQLGSKIVLSLFRVVAITALVYYIRSEVKKNAKTGYVICLAMVLAGAIGNLIDSMFYGLIFNESSPFYVSYFVPFGTGYAPFLMGKVVDMFYFPIIETDWPSWIPLIGGDHFVFFSPVFNFADTSISVSVVLLLLFYREEIGKISLSRTIQKEGES